MYASVCYVVARDTLSIQKKKFVAFAFGVTVIFTRPNLGKKHVVGDIKCPQFDGRRGNYEPSANSKFLPVEVRILTQLLQRTSGGVP